MLWYLILGSVFCTCALATKYAQDNYEQAEQAYEMQKLLDIDSFFEVQNELDKVTKSLNEKHGLKQYAAFVAKKLHYIYPQIEYLLDITKDFANPCSDGIYRNGKCANYVQVSKFIGTEDDARNLCNAHFGEFAIEQIIDYSDGPYGNHGGFYGGDTPNGGGYGGDASNGGGYGGDASNGGYGGDASNGGSYGGDASNGGSYGGDASNGGSYDGGYGGDALNGGSYGGDASTGGGYGGDASTGGSYGGDASNGGSYGGDASNGGSYGGDASTGGGYGGDASTGGGYGGDASTGGSYGGDASNGGGYGGDASNGGSYGGDASNGGLYGGDASNGGGYGGDAPPTGGYFGGDVPPPHGGGDAIPPTEPEDITPPPEPHYVCYEPPVVNIPKSIYFPHETEEEEEEPPRGEEFPNRVNEKWFSGRYDPEADEDECPRSARNGRVIGDMCYSIYIEPTIWDDAKAVCVGRGGNLCEPHATVAQSSVFYALLKANLPEEMAEVETAATPNPSNPDSAQLWLGFLYPIAPTGTDFLSQIGGTNVPSGNSIFVPTVGTTLPYAAALTQPGNSWEGRDPTIKLPFCCQFNLV